VAGKKWTQEMKDAAAAKRAAAKAAGTAPQRPAPARRRAPAVDPVETAVVQIVGVLTLPLMALGSGRESFLADALALEMTAQPLGHAMAEVAKVNPAVGEWLEKGAPATPYLLLGTVLFSLGTQVAVNHGLNIGPLAATTHSRAALVAEKRRQIAELQQAQAEEEQFIRDTAERVAQAEAVEDAERAAAHEADRLEYERRAAEDQWEASDIPAPEVVI
jgi:hypothetical protein